MTNLFINHMNSVNMPQADLQDWNSSGLHCRTQNSL